VPIKRHGTTGARILYWFRTPPYVKVGRAALDDEAMRLLEECHPGVSFDWGRILREAPQQVPEEQAARRREHRDAREAKRKKKRPAEPDAAGLLTAEREEIAEPLEELNAEPEPLEPFEPLEPVEPLEPADSPPAISHSAASDLLGPEGAAHLRSRYAVLMQRIERHPDEAKREELRREAEPLNPSGWDTVEVARLAMEMFEARYEALRALVGGGRRRRRRRRAGGKPGGGAPPTDGV
jgi:hypothetical protein